MKKRTACAIVLLAAFASPAAAQSRDEAFQTLWQDVNGTVAGNTYSQPTSISSTQQWACQTCAPGQRLRIGWYDWAHSYATDDPAQVLRAIAGACQFDPCTTESYHAEGLSGLIQYGTHRTGEAARTYLIASDRLWSFYVQGMPSVEAARAVVLRGEAEILPRLLAAQP